MSRKTVNKKKNRVTSSPVKLEIKEIKSNVARFRICTECGEIVDSINEICSKCASDALVEFTPEDLNEFDDDEIIDIY